MLRKIKESKENKSDSQICKNCHFWDERDTRVKDFGVCNYWTAKTYDDYGIEFPVNIITHFDDSCTHWLD